MAENNTTVLPGGITNAATGSVLESYTQLDPTKNFVFFDDFLLYTAANWTVTETQAGATQAIGSGNGGLLVLTNTTADDDINGIALANKVFVIDPTKKLWMKARLKVDDVTQSDVIIGLGDTLTGFDPADGIYFLKTDGAATLVAQIEDTSATTATAASPALTNDTFFELGLVYSPSASSPAGVPTITAYLNGAPFGNITSFGNLPTAAVTPVIGVRNGVTLEARVLTVDYLLIAQER